MQGLEVQGPARRRARGGGLDRGRSRTDGQRRALRHPAARSIKRRSRTSRSKPARPGSWRRRAASNRHRRSTIRRSRAPRSWRSRCSVSVRRRIWVEAAELGAAAPAKTKSKRRPILLIYALAVAVFPLSMYVLLTDNGPATGPAIARPRLRRSGVIPRDTAPNPRPSQRWHCRDRAALADAKRERRPFHVQDGVKAVPLYEAAAACFGPRTTSRRPAAAYAAAKLRTRRRRRLPHPPRPLWSTRSTSRTGTPRRRKSGFCSRSPTASRTTT